MTGPKIDRYAVFGNPIAHSKSPEIHQAFAEQTGQALTYDKQCVDKDAFAAAAKTFFEQGGAGLNITVPFKEDAFRFAEVLTERAKLAGAVNTLARQPDGKILGDTTDGLGLVNDITEHLNWNIAGKSLLVLGAGGAVRGVLLPLLAASPSGIVVANRTSAKAEQLAEDFSAYGNIKGGGFDSLTSESPFDIIINGTSASLGGDLPPIPASCFSSSSHAYDMVYGPEETPFLGFAKTQGASEVADGLGMLVGQAAESFAIWRGVKPEIAPVLVKLRAML